MASAPSEPRVVSGRIDRSDRLVAADPELEALQRDAGATIGQPLAVPQVAAIAALARKLGIAVARPAIAASADQDIELWVSARPDGEDILLTLEGWTARPPAAPRLASLLAASEQGERGAEQGEWSADEELRLITLSQNLAELLGVDPAEVAGEPLTRILRLEEDEEGNMPLVSALAARRAFTGQRARARGGEGALLVLSGEVVAAADGSFAGFRGTAEEEGAAPGTQGSGDPAAFDFALEEVLRSPLDRIIASAERIVERADGPLRTDYASYGTDIAAAARHLLSVIRSMSADVEQQLEQATVDLGTLAADAVVMLEAVAEERGVKIALAETEPLPARGQERAVIQILVNLIGNAIRHSPQGSIVRLAFLRTAGSASVTVADQGPGIASGDEQRIFERFERADVDKEGAGLGLAIARRLARSMGGDVTLDSGAGEGARFTLTLPTA